MGVVGVAELSEVLWRERELLEMLVFKLEEEHLLLASSNARWLPRATREVEVVVEQLRQVELRRALIVDAAAASLGLPSDPTLAQLADAAPGAWAELLREHRAAFLELTREVQDKADANKLLLSAGYRQAREGLVVLTGRANRESAGYGRTGRAATTATSSQLVDQAF